MAQKRRTENGNTTPKRKPSSGKPSAAKRGAAPAKGRGSSGAPVAPQSAWINWTPFLLIVIAAVLALCLLIPDKLGLLGLGGSSLLLGCFGIPAYLTPVLLLIAAVMMRRIEGRMRSKLLLSLLCMIALCMLFHAFSPVCTEFNPVALWKAGIARQGGGAVGGLVGSLCMWFARQVGTVIIALVMLVICGFWLFDFTPHAAWVTVRFHAKKRREAALAAREQARPEPPRRYRYQVREPEPEQGRVSRVIEENKKIIEGLNEKRKARALQEEELEPIEREIPIPEQVAQDAVGRIGEAERGTIDLDRIFADDTPDEPSDPSPAQDTPGADEPVLVREPVAPAKPAEPREYILPPIRLLKDPGKRSAVAGTEEAQANALKLVKTLASFRVNTHISNISRGPTITRYELVPEEGVRVRSVANLVDDISLSLATEGVRIEAPIPGKSAIGIEVPNRTVETVYLRELIDTEEFQGAKSKLTAALGMDVAGTPRYFDIAKMPHLLIAGATGMGKSVCINSILTSLLYRATPDEVKLILIDPKKVELNIYNGLPHLLVPVVSHPKKAAGTLNWACIEMERRFELIEDVGVRDIAGYNEATEHDPDREYLPQIVIIIDELADLMMTAPDDVENSICRLAQKARAAGMHLIIGTQRPSVDVITGLIKANIPSRIAFTVASQIDSRTILDIAGAEKLIGRGDMLFAPVGSNKPIRVQGSFVSDSEVDAVVEFIKRQSGEVDYDQSVVDSIEKEAERCGTGKKGGAGAAEDAGEDDPRLLEALELVVDAGKASTSLLQRRMSIGYGKAAKMIDQMESHGWVGPPEGSKPRELRITKQQYMEMALNHKDDGQE